MGEGMLESRKMEGRGNTRPDFNALADTEDASIKNSAHDRPFEFLELGARLVDVKRPDNLEEYTHTVASTTVPSCLPY